MPNYCVNTVSVDAAPEVLDQLRCFVASEENAFDFEKIIPMPCNIFMGNIGTDEEKTYGGRNWYDWCNRRWGTKWNSDDTKLEEHAGCLVYSFYTAWSSCEPVIEELSVLFPDAKISYRFYEPGMCFCGMREYENGKTTYTMDGDYTEYYYHGFDEDTIAVFKEMYDKGIFCEADTTADNGRVTACDVSYRDTNEERTIIIVGSYVDARAVKSDFCW